MLLKENGPIRQKVNADIWHNKGYTGKGVNVVLLDHTGRARLDMKDYYIDVLGRQKEIGHATNVGSSAHEFGPDIKVLMFSATHDFDEALAWLKLHKDEVDIINVSLAGVGGSLTPQYLELESLGIPVICASGNDDYENHISYPAGYPFTIAVGALEWRNNNIAGYSNEGAMLDCVCPSGIYMRNEEGEVWAVNGTSFSSPCACGLLACYIQFRKENGLSKLKPEEARSFIRSNCLDLKEAGFDTASGYGLFCLPKEIPIIQKPIEPVPEKPKYWRCQTGAFSVKENAGKLLNQLAAKGYIGYIVQVNSLYKVQLGAFSVEANCRNFSIKLKSENIDNFIVYY